MVWPEGKSASGMSGEFRGCGGRRQIWRRWGVPDEFPVHDREINVLLAQPARAVPCRVTVILCREPGGLGADKCVVLLRLLRRRWRERRDLCRFESGTPHHHQLKFPAATIVGEDRRGRVLAAGARRPTAVLRQTRVAQLR